MRTNVFDTVFAVCDQTKAGATILHGTAFTLGMGVFMTAAHVVEELEDSDAPHLRRLSGKGMTQALPIRASSRLPDIDVGILHVDIDLPPVPMADSHEFQRKDVWTEGFAFGLDLVTKTFASRYLKGHVVSTRKYNNWAEFDLSRTGVHDREVFVHELSFPAPKGQSGAPLFVDDEDGYSRCIGMIIGNSRSAVDTVSQSEVIEDGAVKEVIEYHDFLYLGQAISSASLLKWAIEPTITAASTQSKS